LANKRHAMGNRIRGILKGKAAWLCSAALLWLASASLAQAAPLHPFLEGKVISGLDHACGVAVDSEGDVSLSSAGEDEIRVLDPAHAPLEVIANANEPCGLAVDSTGRLYVSESATGNVVRYTPANYPFVGAPGYGAAEPIDSSTEAKGIAVDPVDDRLYVAKGAQIDTYDAAGVPGSAEISDEVQRVVPTNATGGTYKLCFEGQCSADLAYEANHAAVQAALEALATIGAGNVSVTDGPNEPFFEGREHKITFTGAMAQTSLPQITCKPQLTGESAICSAVTLEDGFSGHIDTDPLANYTGLAAYTYANGDLYVFAADEAADQVKIFSSGSFSSPAIKRLRLRKTIAGPKAGEDFGFGAAGTHLAADTGTCPPTEDACTAGHFFVYDDAHKAVDEFEASGEFLAQVPSPEAPFAFEDAEPTAIAVDRSGGPNEGTLYVTSGAGPGARALAFGPLVAPSRAPKEELSFAQENVCGMAVDAHGNRYLAADTTIKVYPPTSNTPLVTITDPGNPCDLAVDSVGNVWALDRGAGGSSDDKVVYFKPSAFPPTGGTTYDPPVTCATSKPPHFPNEAGLTSIGLDPGDDHVFVNQARTIELDSAENGCALLHRDFAPSSPLPRSDLAVCEKSGNVYLAAGEEVRVLSEDGGEALAKINGSGSFVGPFSVLHHTQTSIEVDQSNCHLLLFFAPREAIEEYEASGAFVGQFVSDTGPFESALRRPGIAVDNGASSPNEGHLYLAYDDPNLANPYDLAAFEPLAYGEPPQALTTTASNLGGGDATLNGTLDPNKIEVEDCHFEYLTDAAYLQNTEEEKPPFEGAVSAPCAESAAEIGKGTSPVPVHAEISGLDPEGRYRFRLLASNKFGTDTGEAVLFGPPVITLKPTPPSYTEATLRAIVDPAGLETACHFAYGPSAAYGAQTSVQTLAGSAAPTEIKAPVFKLDEGTVYHFRLLCENEAKAIEGTDQEFKTLSRPESPPCPNEEFRTGRSAALPDCRAYELVTPPDTRGATPFAAPSPGGTQFNNWLADPRGEGAGESVAYFIDSTTLPGFEGNGTEDGFRAARKAGAHPEAGWRNEIMSPSYLQGGGAQPSQRGVSADQLYWFWRVSSPEVFEGTLPIGVYLRTPTGFEPLGQGSLGADPEPDGRFIAAGGTHVIFESDAQLEPEAPPAGTTALYDRSPGGPTHVVSLKPGEAPFAAGEDAAILGYTEDGSAVAFEVEGTIYLRIGNSETIEITDEPNTSFAGVSADAGRLFYTTGDPAPGDLWLFEVGSPPPTEPFAKNATFVNVSADGSAAYFTSEEVLDGAEEGTEGKDNLYLFDGAAIRHIAVLDPADVTGLGKWTAGLSFGGGLFGRAEDPSRSTPDGEVFVFESRADLTAYESEGHTQVYRYHAGEESLACVSCDPSGDPPGAGSTLQNLDEFLAPTARSTLIANVTDDGMAVFFESADPLLPEDANEVRDVYEWKAPGKGTAGSCELEGGCLELISSGQGERQNYLYGMSAEGHDVFFTTLERLHGQDIPESPSIYDARIEGGIPDPPTAAPCEGDACQGQGTPPPALPAPASTGSAGGGNFTPKPRCPKGKRKVRTKSGKVRCAKKPSKKHRGANRSKARRGAR
jgi:hypothetical protein